MKTQKKINENNKLIAEFMGLKPQSKKDNRYFDCPDKYYKYDVGEYRITNTCYPYDMEYHTSWDWLMPVIEKINLMGYEVLIGRIFCQVKEVSDWERISCLVCGDISKKIEIVYDTIVNFIKWYNENE